MKKLQFNEENFNMLLERMKYLREEVIKYKYDFLTGLKQRKDFDVKLNDFYESFEFESKSFIFIMLEADGLHNVNRNIGYEAGDDLLVSIAKQIEEIFDECINSHIFRISGDEFAVLLSTKYSKTEIIEKLKDLENCTYSILNIDGSVCFPSPSSIFKEADIQLTKNKSSNKEQQRA